MGGSKEHEHGFCEIEQKKKKKRSLQRDPCLFRAWREMRAGTHTRGASFSGHACALHVHCPKGWCAGTRRTEGWRSFYIILLKGYLHACK